jgi:hypothetical protein
MLSPAFGSITELIKNSLAMTDLSQLEFHLALDPPVFSSSARRLRYPHRHFANLHLIADQIILDATARFI